MADGIRPNLNKNNIRSGPRMRVREGESLVQIEQTHELAEPMVAAMRIHRSVTCVASAGQSLSCWHLDS